MIVRGVYYTLVSLGGDRRQETGDRRQEFRSSGVSGALHGQAREDLRRNQHSEIEDELEFEGRLEAKE
jgi:hypothetical protein